MRQHRWIYGRGKNVRALIDRAPANPYIPCMSLKVGIVGLPNVGKSTLFNALTKQAVAARNVPFTTIDPNVGVVPVPDERLEKLAAFSKSEKVVPTSIEFVDIAGLVKNAHQGEGLGNKFLSHIREVDAIVHVVRFFENSDITHVENRVDPAADAETIETELALADLETVKKLLDKTEDEAKGSTSAQGYGGRSKIAKEQLPIIKRLHDHLASGKPARTLTLTEKEKKDLGPIPLLTSKPTLYVANLSENQIQKADEVIAEFSKKFSPALPISVKIEQELVELSDEERAAFLQEYGLKDTGLNRLIQAGYQLLNLITFLTTGPDETRAWTVRKGAKAPEAAGKIHTDLEKGFIRAETINWQELLSAGSYAAARAAGKVRDEGKDYVVQDGDVIIVKFSV